MHHCVKWPLSADQGGDLADLCGVGLAPGQRSRIVVSAGRSSHGGSLGLAVGLSQQRASSRHSHDIKASFESAGYYPPADEARPAEDEQTAATMRLGAVHVRAGRGGSTENGAMTRNSRMRERVRPCRYSYTLAAARIRGRLSPVRPTVRGQSEQPRDPWLRALARGGCAHLACGAKFTGMKTCGLEAPSAHSKWEY